MQMGYQGTKKENQQRDLPVNAVGIETLPRLSLPESDACLIVG
jgi:hypothetical protein